MRKVFLGALLFASIAISSEAAAPIAVGKPIAIDSRIKTYIYSENEVFRIVVHYGYQTSLEFADGEEIQTISVGNNYAWQITPIGRRLFIRPIEENIATNMTIITNKRIYHFDVQSKALSYATDEELVYVVRFFFPESDFDTTSMQVNAKEQDPVPVAKPFNFNYTLTGPEKIAPTKIFDDGVNTFFKFPSDVKDLPTFESGMGDQYVAQAPRRRGDYVVLNTVSERFRLSYPGKKIVEVFNEQKNSGEAR